MGINEDMFDEENRERALREVLPTACDPSEKKKQEHCVGEGRSVEAWCEVGESWLSKKKQYQETLGSIY